MAPGGTFEHFEQLGVRRRSESGAKRREVFSVKYRLNVSGAEIASTVKLGGQALDIGPDPPVGDNPISQQSTLGESGEHPIEIAVAIFLQRDPEFAFLVAERADPIG
jgi:hypothetical protein